LIFYATFAIILVSMDKVIIPKNLAQDDLVVIARSEYERLLELQNPALSSDGEEAVSEDDVLRWSKEARQAKQSGTLPRLNSLRDLR